jgi:hypothetical protein
MARRRAIGIIVLKIVFTLQCVYETGGGWVPGGEGRRTGSDPGGSSPKASPSGAQDHLVAIGLMDTLSFFRPRLASS